MTFDEVRRRADQVRTIPLETVLLADGAQQDRYDWAKWHTRRGTLSVTGVKFMNWNHGVGGGGAIDLAMHLGDMGFKEAVQWLWDLCPGSFSAGDTQRQIKPGLLMPAKYAAHLPRVRSYLTITRKIPASMVDSLIAAGSIYADRYGNAVFPLLGRRKDLVGAELRGTRARPWRGMARGSRKDDGYFSVRQGPPRRIILCESAVDAVSCAVLSRSSWCISTAGVRASPAWLDNLLRMDCPIFCGFDADPAGDDAARTMIALHPGISRLRPTLLDWNEVLMAQT